ncbi:MAG: desulfoferrodoxin family protein [bacterium]
MEGFVCKMCGYVAINGRAPEKCPVCGAPKTAFDKKSDALKTDQEKTEKGESEKKHIPAITVVKKCGLIEGCVDVHVRVGEILHPMLKEHFIGSIDFYINKEFISRVTLNPEVLNPAAALHLKVQKGTVSAIEHCNLHGAWIKEAEI